MGRLGLALTLKGGRETAARLSLTVAAVALGVVILLGVFSAYHALQETADRPSWAATAAAGDPAAPLPLTSANVLLWNYTESVYRGKSIEQVRVSATGPDAPAVPGVPELPAPGEFYASPALASLLRTVPADQLGDRFPGRLAGGIGQDGLSSPNQLAAIGGATPEQLLEQDGTVAVARIAAAGVSSGTRQVLLIAALAILFPLLILVNTATRLAATRREERYAAMRLVGATPRQINTVASVDAAAGAFLGALLGSLVFVAVRPALASSSFAAARFFPADLTPVWWGYAGAIAAVPCVAMVSSLLSLRRVRISPLGVTRKASTKKRPRAWRLAPLAAGAAIVPGAAAQVSKSLRETGASDPLMLFAGLLLIMVGVVLSGPWLTLMVAKLVARTTRAPSSLLATRRLADNPKQAFRTVSSLVLAVFIGSFVAAMVPALGRAQDPPGQSSLRDVLRVNFNTWPFATGLPPEAAAELTGRLESADGVAAVPLYMNPAFAEAGQPVSDAAPSVSPPPAFVAACASVAQIPALGSCAPGARWVAVAAENVLGGDSPLSVYQSLPVATPDSPEYTADAATLLLAGVLVEVNSPGTLERIRTDLTAWPVTAPPQTIGEVSAASNAQYAGFERAVLAFIVLTLVTAGCSLAISIGGGLLERKRPFTLLRVNGVRRRTLDAVVLIEAALPLVAGSLIAAGIGLGAGIPAIGSVLAAFASDGAPTRVYPGVGYHVALAGGLAAALGLVAATLPLLHRITRPENVRFE